MAYAGKLVKKGGAGKGGTVPDAGTATHRRQVFERHGASYRIDVSRRTTFGENQGAHWQGRLIAPLPPRLFQGFSQEPWSRRAP